jgi:hypothetical protein
VSKPNDLTLSAWYALFTDSLAGCLILDSHAQDELETQKKKEKKPFCRLVLLKIEIT